jgi:hypothetical protein
MALLAVSVLSCGGGGGGGNGTCGQVEACGGSVVGTWKAGAACANSAFLTMSFEQGLMGVCPTATISNVSVSQSGTLTFNADMTYSASIDDTYSFNFAIPSSCNTSGASCGTLATYIELASPGTTVGCLGTGSCSCHVSMSQPQSDTGTYAISPAGESIAINSTSNATTSNADFCVQGNTLHLLQIDDTTNMGPMGQATIDTDETFTKQ